MHSGLADDRFSDELAAIIKLSDKLHDLLKHYEACLQGTSWPRKVSNVDLEVKPADRDSDLWEVTSLTGSNLLRDDEQTSKGFDNSMYEVCVPGSIDFPRKNGTDSQTSRPKRLLQSSSTESTIIHSHELKAAWSDLQDPAHQEVVAFYETCFAQLDENAVTSATTDASLGMIHRRSDFLHVTGTRSKKGRVTSRISSSSTEEVGHRVEACIKHGGQILHPSGRVRTIWNLVTFFLIAIDMITIPLMVFGVGNSSPWEVFAWFATLFWTLDMLLSFRTGYFIGVKVEMRAKQIAIQYAKSWLLLDIFIVLFEWFCRFFNTVASASLVRTTRTVRVVRLVKLTRVARMKKLMLDFAERINSNYAYLLGRILFLTAVLCILAHYVTCAWYALGTFRDDSWTTYDLYAVREGEDVGFLYWYVSSARWVISQLNGRTDMDERRNILERGFTVIGGLSLSIVGQAVFISLITKAMLELTHLFKEQQTRRRTVNEFLSLHALPLTVERCVKMHAKEYKDINIETKKEQLVLSLLPKILQSELLYEIRKPLVMKHPLLGVIMEEFRTSARRLCHKGLKQIQAVSGEMVFEKKDTCTRMLIIISGRAIYGPPEACKASYLDMELAIANAGRGSVFTQKVKDFAPNIKHLLRGRWVSEAALWVTWKNRGRLATENNCCMLELDEILLAGSLQEELHAFCLSVVYAQHFVQFLNEQEVLSDLTAFKAPNMCNIFDGTLELFMENPVMVEVARRKS